MVKEVGKKVEKLLLLYEHFIDQVCEISKKPARRLAPSNKKQSNRYCKRIYTPWFQTKYTVSTRCIPLAITGSGKG